MTVLKKTLLLIPLALAFGGCTTEPETNKAKPAESVSATPVPSATPAATATPSPASTSTPAQAASPGKPNEKDDEK